MGNFPTDYNVPESQGGSYMKLQDKNKVRVLMPPVIGTEYWVETPDGDKPKRVLPDVEVPIGDVCTNKFGNLSISHWHGYAVFDYADSSVKILNITQKTIQQALYGLDKDEDWGDITKYDITITRNEDGKGYTITPVPPKPLTEEIQNIVDSTPVNLDALYVSEKSPYGGNPFVDEISDDTAKKVKDGSIDPEDIPF